MRVLQFIKEVRSEAVRITWPENKEVLLTLAFVIFVATFSGIMFLLIDSMVYKLIKLFLGFGGF